MFVQQVHRLVSHGTALGIARWSLVVLLAVAIGPAAAQEGGRPVLVELVPPGILAADGSLQKLTFVVTDTMGQLAEDAYFTGTRADFGKITDWNRMSPGVWSADYTPPDTSGMSQVRVALKVKVGREVVRKDFFLELRPQSVHTLTLSTDKDELVKKRDRGADIHILAQAPDDGPLDGLNLRVEATVGEVKNLQGHGGGEYTARYVLPDGKPKPGLTILSVVDLDHPHDAVDFHVIPLVGNVVYEVDTGRAGVPVNLKVGDRRFGPVDADENGVAGVPILVPPGIETAVASMDLGDGTMDQPIDLRVPPYCQLAVAHTAEHFPGDGISSYPIFIHVVSRAGTPVSNAPVQVTASAGVISAPKHKRGGVYVAQYTPPPVQAVTPVTVTVSVPGAEENSDTTSFDVVPPLPSQLVARTEPAYLEGGEASLQLHAAVNALDGASAEKLGVWLYAREGELTDVAAMGQGSYATSWAGNFDEPVAFLAVSSTEALVRPPVCLVAWAVDEQVPIEGTTTVVAVALDRYGLPVSGVDLSADTILGGGSFSDGGVTDERGRVVFTFTAAPLGGLSLVEIRGGQLSFALPIWQSAGSPDRFEFPRCGGTDRLHLLDQWDPLVHRLLVGAGIGAPPEEATEEAPAE